MVSYSLFNHLFDHVYVVSIARAKDRHMAIAEALQGLDYELFMGADASQFNMADMETAGLYNEKRSIDNNRYGKALTGGALWCS